MTPVTEPSHDEATTCGRCGTPIDGCGFCGDEGCHTLLCYRCVRIVLRQQVAQPHAHGG